MVMDDLPGPVLAAVDVCDAVIDGDRLSGQCKLTLFESHFIGNIAGNLNELFVQVKSARLRPVGLPGPTAP